MATENLKIEIESIVSALRGEGKTSLALCIDTNWNKTAALYSTELNSWQYQKGMEPELREAFGRELDRLEVKEDLKSKILNSLEKRRILQTAPHLVAIESPRMLCINWLGSLGVNPEDFYVVAMFSGIPFSNSFRPGRINFKENSVNLFTSSMQDGLVYRSLIQSKLGDAVKNLSPLITSLLPQGIPGESFTKWALQSCTNIEKKILGKNNLVFLDMNEVVVEYLIKVLRNKTHVMYKIFFDPKTRVEFKKAFPKETIFYHPASDGKYEKTESMTFSTDTLKSRTREISLKDPEELIAGLKNDRLCPGLAISFLVFAFLNDFKCFGSFYQVEYLPKYQEKFAQLEFMSGLDISKVPTANLTTGVFPDNVDLYPADIIEGKKFDPSPEILFGELLLPIRDYLIHGRQTKK